MASGKSPVVRQTLIVVSFLALVGLFFALNHLIVIPRQQQAYNNKVFRILEEAADGFKKSLTGKTEFYARNPTNQDGSINPDPPAVDTHTVCDTSLKQKLFYSFFTLGANADKAPYSRKLYTFITDTIKLAVIDTTPNKAVSVTKNIAIQEVLEPNIALLHKDVFDMVMLVKRDRDSVAESAKKVQLIRDRLLYKFGTLAAGYILPGDTLFQEPRFGQFSSISDITIAGTPYKAFTLPFRFEGNELMLTGFLKEKKYKVVTTSYSVPTLLWVVFLLSLFFLSLPLIKIYLSSRQERISTNDLRMLMVVFTVVPLIITLAAITLLLYRQTDEKTDNDLVSLHRNVQESLQKEVGLAVGQLKAYNTLLQSRSDEEWCQVYTQYKDSLHDKADTADLRNVLLYPALYRNVDDVFWVNESGIQVAKWFFTRKQEPVYYFDLSPRPYFQRMKANRTYTSDSGRFYFEPTISWSSGNYSINIVAPSQQAFLHPFKEGDSTRAIMAGIGTSLYSVCHPVVPKAYNFCIIAENGEILFHAETERSLHENVFDESENNEALQDAVYKKDSVLIPDIMLFEHNTKALVTPVEGMPGLTLISYFNKREQNLFVFHISAFTLLCTALALFGVLLLVLLHYFFGSKTTRRRIYIYDSAWIKPSRKKIPFYLQNIRQLLAVVAAALVVFSCLFLFGEDQYWYLMQAGMLLPFFVVTGYVLLRNEYNLKRKAEEKEKMGSAGTPLPTVSFAEKPAITGTKVSGFRLTFSERFTVFLRRNWRVLLIYLLGVSFVLLSLNIFQDTGFRFAPVFFIVLLCFAVPLLAYQHSLPGQNYTVADTTNYLAYYSLLVFLCTFVISVLPAVCITSFALNEERKMQTKATQFITAKNIETRRDSLNHYFATSKLGSEAYIKDRKLSEAYGIYLLHNRLRTTPLPARDTVDTLSHSGFYRDVTRFLFLPKDHADFFDDNASYFWYQSSQNGQKTISLAYANETDNQTRESVILQQVPQKSSLLGTMLSSYSGWLIFLGLAAFFIFQYMLIQTVAKKIFLLDYFSFEEAEKRQDNTTVPVTPDLPPAPKDDWVNSHYASLSLTPAEKAFFSLKEEPLTNAAIDRKETECQQTFQQEEEQVLRIQYILTPAYDAIWNSLKSPEKLVLYDFALDGFTNYKNVDILYTLYEKGLLRKKNYQLELMNYSFRSYLLGKSGTQDIMALVQELSFGSTWKNLKNIFFVLFFAIMIFLFATQQDVSNRILAIVSGLATLVPFLLKIFDRNLGSGGSKQGS